MNILEETSAGGRLGAALGTGLQNLAQSKINEINQRNERLRQQQTFQSLPGSTQEFAQFMANLSPEERKNVWPNIGGLLSLYNPQQTAAQPAVEGQLTPQQNALQEAFKSPMTKLREKEVALKEEEVGRKSAREVREFSKPYRDRAEASKSNIRDYDLLIKLADKGDIRAGNSYQLLKKVGLEGLNQNLTTELVGKITSRLGQNAASAFGPGARLTNFLEQTFQKSLPTLWNTPKGIKTISQINKLTDEANLLKDEAQKQLIRENKGRIPYDADAQIDERTRPAIQQLEDKALTIALTAEFPPASNFKPDAQGNPPIAEDNGVKFTVQNGEWVMLPEGS